MNSSRLAQRGKYRVCKYRLHFFDKGLLLYMQANLEQIKAAVVLLQHLNK